MAVLAEEEGSEQYRAGEIVAHSAETDAYLVAYDPGLGPLLGGLIYS